MTVSETPPAALETTVPPLGGAGDDGPAAAITFHPLHGVGAGAC